MMEKWLQSCLLICVACCSVQGATSYFGKYIGPLHGYHHEVQGEVYAVDARTLHIKDFTYDGQGPAAFFWVGSSSQPDTSGFALRDEKQSGNELKQYRKKSVTLSLPEGKSLNQIKWLSIWCESAQVNFGDVRIPKGFDYPRPQKIGQLAGVHGVSSDPIVIVDAQTLLVPNFSYDGEAPDAKFWVGTGPHPSPRGIRVPDENGKEEPLRRYNRKTIVLTLPADLTVFEIGHFGVWCEAFTVDFGHLQIPANANIPPSLKMLGVSPQSKLNCEVLHDSSAFEVRWAIAGDSIVLQLVSKLVVRPYHNFKLGEYMSFGLSGDPLRNQMIGADVVVAWIDQETLNGYAVDYYLTDKSQCAGGRGSCPDSRIQENSDSVRLLNAALVNGYSIVTYQRPLRSHDILDHDIYTNQSQAVIWALGPLNSKQEVSFHSVFSKKNILIDFGRTPYWNCPIPEGETGTPNHDQYTDTTVHSAGANQIPVVPAVRTQQIPTPAPAPQDEAWEIPPIQCNEPEDGVLYAQMGPTGGKRGYPAITGHVGWGISWYINGLLIPEINVVRGKTYTFIVEGGLDPAIPAKYHPFYITDDPVGGFLHKTKEEKEKVRIFAGAKREKSGDIVATGVGRLCNWTPDPEQPPADEFVSFGAYQRTLSLICDHGEPGVIQWTPDVNTPDTVYYQCFTHRYLGWKINVHNSCDREAQSSEPVTTRVHPSGDGGDYTDEQTSDSELESKPSIKVTTRVKPDKSSAELTAIHRDLSTLIPHKFKENLAKDFKSTGEIPEFALSGEKFNGYNQHELFRQAMEERERQHKEKERENEVKRKREQEKDGEPNKYEVKEDQNDQSIDENRKDVGVPSSTTSVLIQQSLEPLTIHEKEIHHEQKATINQTIEHHFQQNLDLNPEKSVPVAYVLNGVNGNHQYSTNQPFLLTTYGGNQNFISTSQHPNKQPMVVYPSNPNNQKENKINAYSLIPTTPLSAQKYSQQPQVYSTIINNQQYSTMKYATTPSTPIYLQNPISIPGPASGQYRGNEYLPTKAGTFTSYSQNQGPPQQVSHFSQGHRVQAHQKYPQQSQFSNAPVNYNPYSNYQGVGTPPHAQGNKDSNIPYKTGYILLQNNNPKRPVNVNVYKRPLTSNNMRRPNVIIKKPIYKNKGNGQSAQPTKHIMLVKPISGGLQSASSLSQVVITPKVKGAADTFPTTPSKKVTVTYSTSSAQANLNKIKPVLPLLVADKPYEIAHAKIQKKSEILAPSIPVRSGFNPSSVVIESGFKPILGVEEEAQKRMGDDDVEYIDETTVANFIEHVTNASNVLEAKQTVNFEPIFIPSPPDQQKLRKEKKPVRQVLVRKRVSPYVQDDRNQYKSRQDTSNEQVKTYFLPPSGPIYGIPKNLNKKVDKVTHAKKDLLHAPEVQRSAEEKETKKEDVTSKPKDDKEIAKPEVKSSAVIDNNEIQKVNNLKEESNATTLQQQLLTTPKYKNHKYEEVKRINEKLATNVDDEENIESDDEKADYTVIDSVEDGRNEKKIKFTRKYSLLRPRRSPHHHPDHKGNDTAHEEVDSDDHKHDNTESGHRDRRSPHHHPNHKGHSTEDKHDSIDHKPDNIDHKHDNTESGHRDRRSPHHHPDHKGNGTEDKHDNIDHKHDNIDHKHDNTESGHRDRRSPHHHPDHKGNSTEDKHDSIDHKPDNIDHKHDNIDHKNDNTNSKNDHIEPNHRHKRTPSPHHTPDHHGDASDYEDDHDHQHHDHHHHPNVTTTKSSATTYSMSIFVLVMLQSMLNRLR